MYQRLSQRMLDISGDRGVLKDVIREGVGELVTPDASVLGEGWDPRNRCDCIAGGEGREKPPPYPLTPSGHPQLDLRGNTGAPFSSSLPSASSNNASPNPRPGMGATIGEGERGEGPLCRFYLYYNLLSLLGRSQIFRLPGAHGQTL